jgi:hypothetical protein
MMTIPQIQQAVNEALGRVAELERNIEELRQQLDLTRQPQNEPMPAPFPSTGIGRR